MKESSGEDSRELRDLELRIPPTTITSQLRLELKAEPTNQGQLRLEHTRPELRIELRVVQVLEILTPTQDRPHTLLITSKEAQLTRQQAT